MSVAVKTSAKKNAPNFGVSFTKIEKSNADQFWRIEVSPEQTGSEFMWYLKSAAGINAHSWTNGPIHIIRSWGSMSRTMFAHLHH